jgi:hypothetical protein
MRISAASVRTYGWFFLWRVQLPALGLEGAPMVGTIAAWLGPTVEGDLSTGRYNF